MKCRDVFAVNTMDISFVFNIPELVPSSVSSPSAALVKKTSMKGKGKFSAVPWDMNGFNNSGEDLERVSHAMSDSYFIHRSRPILKVP